MSTQKVVLHSNLVVCFYDFFFVIVVFCFVFSAKPVFAQKTKKVLVLVSYHYREPWAEIVSDGITSVFEKSDVRTELFWEHMDTRRYALSLVEPHLEKLYEEKYGSTKFDVVICVDNNALKFALCHRALLFPDVPIVFCGITDYPQSFLAKQHCVTGIFENFRIAGTITLALKMHREAKKVVLIKDKFVKDADVNEWSEIFAERAEIICIDPSKMVLKEFLKKIERLGRESVVILPVLFYDSGGPYSKEKAIVFIKQHCRAPLYSAGYLWIGLGVVGGRVNNGFHHGRIAAERVLRILNGEDPNNMLMEPGPPDYMFDYVELKRFGIPISKLPYGAIVINEPGSFYYRYSTQIWEVLALIVFLAVIIIILFINILYRRHMEEKLRQSESKFRAVFENAGSALFIADTETGIILECNSQAEKLVGKRRDQMIGMHQSKLHPEDVQQLYTEKFRRHVHADSVVDYESEIQRIDGKKIPVWISAHTVKNSSGRNVVIGLFMDASGSKKVEKKLLDYQKQLKSLASKLSLVEEQERRRIATELHDQIGQTLVILRMKVGSLKKLSDFSNIEKELKEICETLDETIEGTRSLTFDLSYPILYEVGFEAAVAEWLTEQIQKKYGIETRFTDDGQFKPLGIDIKALLFRDVRELLINVVKHAKASKVKVDIYKNNGEVYITIWDDGCGFDVETVESQAIGAGSFGLFSIRERLEQLGGHLEIKSGIGQGACVTIVVPL